MAERFFEKINEIKSAKEEESSDFNELLNSLNSEYGIMLDE